MKNSDQFCNVYLKLRFISFKMMPVETSLWLHTHQHATSRDTYKGTIVMKYFSCVISSELKLFARCKRYGRILVACICILQKPIVFFFFFFFLLFFFFFLFFFVVFDFLMNVKIDFHISHRQNCPVKYIWSFETPLLIFYQTSCPH